MKKFEFSEFGCYIDGFMIYIRILGYYFVIYKSGFWVIILNACTFSVTDSHLPMVNCNYFRFINTGDHAAFVPKLGFSV